MDIAAISAILKRDLESLHQFTATPGNGTTRLPFTKEARGGANQVRALMQDAGLTVHEDEAGNVIGVLEGEDTSLPAVITGSHYDSVVSGGNFDGPAGIVTGITIARMMKENGIKPKRNYIVIGFNDEEGMRFTSGYFGSRAWLGEIPQQDLHTYTDKDGVSIYEAMKSHGLTPEDLPKAKWDLSTVKAFMEMHIEQGPVLDMQKENLGLVECIVGIRRYMVTISGRSDHAGTTPMDMRMDAVEAASKVISRIPDWAREEGEGTVATTGFMKVLPGGMNIVSEEVQFSIDIRSRNNGILVNMTKRIEDALKAVCAETRTGYRMEEKLITEPVDLNAAMLDTMEESCKKGGYSYRRMVSGAGHDSLVIAPHIDTVMIFAPSKDGRSHCPVEWTEYDDIARAASVMYDLVLSLQ